MLANRIAITQPGSPEVLPLETAEVGDPGPNDADRRRMPAQQLVLLPG